jgi:hypothetical protein
MQKNKRIGKVVISIDIIENRPEVVHLIFSRFIPFRAEMMWHEGQVEYIGVCDMFDEREEGAKTPEYVFECTTTATGPIISGLTKH